MDCALLPNLKTGLYNMPESGYPCMFTSTDAKIGSFILKMRQCILCDRRLLFIDGQTIMTSINWIRDHVHEMKAFLHWEYDLKSFLDFVIAHQHEKGFFYELIKQMDDPHWTYVSEAERLLFPDDNLAFTRLEIEADVEYLVVQGVLQVYQATGDRAWALEKLPALEKAIDYVTSDPKRWDAKHGLVKRAFTIDTWDFVNGQDDHDRRIEPDTPMGIMHGDNSGVYSAMKTLAFFLNMAGETQKAQEYECRAETLKEHMIRYLWNGQFFIHHLPLNHKGVDNLENQRLSLSNTYDINRGVTTVEQSRSIIETYMRRAKNGCEWFSIDPPYDKFGVHAYGKYVNGCFSPFTAGELACAALQCGYEQYGYDIICRMMKQVEKDGTIYFLYDPSSFQNKGGGPSGWGAAAMLHAIDRGLSGVEDLDALYRHMRFSPRYPVTPYADIRYVTGYEASHCRVDIQYHSEETGMCYRVRCKPNKMDCHIYLPNDKTMGEMTVNGECMPFTISRVGISTYADFSIDNRKGEVLIQIRWESKA